MTEEPPCAEITRTEITGSAITMNGDQRTVASGMTVTELVSELTGRPIASDGRATDGTRLGVAVARNATVVPRSKWSSTLLASGDDIEIVTAVQGG